ncbi:uncharacterized protein DS421_2g37350 [Arachis hypogaea]|nr:uncharacterized protein DS421_2g37350 [Arachis hypogaea]
MAWRWHRARGTNRLTRTRPSHSQTTHACACLTRTRRMQILIPAPHCTTTTHKHCCLTPSKAQPFTKLGVDPTKQVVPIHQLKTC